MFPMYWSQLGIATIREAQLPLLMRAAYMQGTKYLPLGQMALEKIRNLPREEQALALCGIRFLRAGLTLVAETENGADVLVRGRDYAALLDDAVSVSVPPQTPDPDGNAPPAPFPTPGVKTIAQISEFTKLPVTSQMKSLVMVVDSAFVLVLLRGDHHLNEAKLRRLLAGARLRQATRDELRVKFGADAGSLGPVSIQGIRILADDALRGRKNMIAGANQNDFHLRNVTPGRGFPCEYADLRRVNNSDSCVNGGPLTFHKVRILSSPESILETIAEQTSDADGLRLPLAVAPFQVLIAPLHPAHFKAGTMLHDELAEKGFEVLLDDRDVRPGVKFKDADLVGIPYRLNLGQKLTEGIVEVVRRSPREMAEVKLDEVVGWLRSSI
jgi:prolyl-tRNA synthetase